MELKRRKEAKGQTVEELVGPSKKSSEQTASFRVSVPRHNQSSPSLDVNVREEVLGACYWSLEHSVHFHVDGRWYGDIYHLDVHSLIRLSK